MQFKRAFAAVLILLLSMTSCVLNDSSPPITKVSDLEGQTVAVIHLPTSSTPEEIAEIEGFTPGKVLVCETINEALAALKSGRAKAILGIYKDEANFVVDVGQKIKDSLLRQYALEKTPNKPIIYLLFLNLDKLSESERGKLREKIIGCIPTGLNDSKYNGFTSIAFRVVNSEQLKEHGIICTAKAD
jgi:hypothetical protein